MTPSLYQRLLGDAWHDLPDVLRQVHGTDARLTARGEMDVTLGRFIGAGFVRWALRMPRKEGRVPVELRVRREGERELWERRIGAWRFPTEQSTEDGLLIERYGSLLFPMTVTSDSKALTHSSDRMLLRARPPLARPALALGPHLGDGAPLRERSRRDGRLRAHRDTLRPTPRRLRRNAAGV